SSSTRLARARCGATAWACRPPRGCSSMPAASRRRSTSTCWRKPCADSARPTRCWRSAPARRRRRANVSSCSPSCRTRWHWRACRVVRLEPDPAAAADALSTAAARQRPHAQRSGGAAVAHRQPAAMKAALCVVLHDVAPATHAACERTLHAVRDVADVPVTLLAVPRYHCEPSPAAFGEWLRERSAAGDEVALHGYTHIDEGVPRNFVDHLRRRHYTRGEGEFADLSITEAMRRLTAGVRWFARQRLPLQGFVAPAWLMSLGTWEALRWLDLSYTCTLRRLVLLPDRRHLTSQSLVYSSSSAWRRQASLAWNAAVAAM